MKCYKCKDGIIYTKVKKVTIANLCENCGGVGELILDNDLEFEKLLIKSTEELKNIPIKKVTIE